MAIAASVSQGYSASSLILEADTLDPFDTGKYAYEFLTINTHLPGVVIESNESIIGYVDRASLMGRFSRQLMRDLYENRPVTLIMDHAPLIVEENTTIKALAERITEEKPEALTAGFVISRRGRYLGIGTAIELMRLSVEESERRSEELIVAHKELRERKVALHDLANSFESTLGDIVQTVTSASIEMQVAAQILSAISEVGIQVSQSSLMSSKAVVDVHRTSAAVVRLDDVASKIGKVVGIISGVAKQTNLLSLNATIESARAGPLGRGFGVVANEVKVLATETARATGEISEHLAAIQGLTGEAVRSITDIGQTIQQVDAISSSITTLVERQAAATREIMNNNNLNQRIQKKNYTGSNDSELASYEIRSAATEVFGTASRLMEQSKRFETELRVFLSTFREM